MFKEAIQKYLTSHTDDVLPSQFPTFEQYGLNQLPTNDMISGILLYEFYKNEDYYTSNIQELSSSKFLRMDHTFKVATNIGYVHRKQSKLCSAGYQYEHWQPNIDSKIYGDISF